MPPSNSLHLPLLGFLSLAMEKGHLNDADVDITCLAPCQCSPTRYVTHSVRPYTYIRRSNPAWVTPSAGVCDVEVRVSRFAKGWVALKAATLAAPLAGNKSVNTDTLYHLGYERPVVLTEKALQSTVVH